MRNRRKAHLWGHAAERVAALLLACKGYRILARRYRSPYGEIDLVARGWGVLAFVEVKARPSVEEGLEAIGARQRVRIERAAAAFLQSHPRHAALAMRFDVIACPPWRIPRHIPDAWRPQR